MSSARMRTIFGRVVDAAVVVIATTAIVAKNAVVKTRMVSGILIARSANARG